jgi:hypothetical protein
VKQRHPLRDCDQRAHGDGATSLDALGVDPSQMPAVTRDQVK